MTLQQTMVCTVSIHNNLEPLWPCYFNCLIESTVPFTKIHILTHCDPIAFLTPRGDCICARHQWWGDEFNTRDAPSRQNRAGHGHPAPFHGIERDISICKDGIGWFLGHLTTPFHFNFTQHFSRKTWREEKRREENTLLRRPRRRWEDNIKTILNK
jgi:hypothetical protein